MNDIVNRKNNIRFSKELLESLNTNDKLLLGIGALYTITLLYNLASETIEKSDSLDFGCEIGNFKMSLKMVAS